MDTELRSHLAAAEAQRIGGEAGRAARMEELRHTLTRPTSEYLRLGAGSRGTGSAAVVY